jgi:quercetin dioxygenase-like cupin family protein
MKVVNYRELPSKPYENDTAHNAKGRLLIGQADGAPNFAMRIFELAENGSTMHHSHPYEHEIFVHQGKGQVFENGQWIDIKAGDAVFIPGGQVHQLRNAGNEPFLFVCAVPKGAPEL